MRSSEFQPNLANIVESSCSNAFFAQNKGIRLYRGLYRSSDQFIGTIRQDRRPRNSNYYGVKIFDTFMSVCGWPHRKSNTLSTAMDWTLADMYGESYQIYPFDGASYLYSSHVRDFIKIPVLIRKYFGIESMADFFETGVDMVSQMEQHKEELIEETGLQQTSDLSTVDNAEGEILIYGSKYVATKVPIEGVTSYSYK